MITLEAVRSTEAAALYAARYMGKGDELTPYKSAAEAMFSVLSTMSIKARVVVGGKDDGCPLRDGTVLGAESDHELDLALKAIDGKRTCARGGHNAISIIAVGDPGAFMEVPKVKMTKIAVGPEAKGVVDINQPVEINIKRVARAKGKYIDDITVCVLDRPHNEPLIDDIRKTGAKIKFIPDGDVSGAISAALKDSSVDILLGIGGAKEGVLAAAALKCLGGDIQTKYVFLNEEERRLGEEAGITDLEKVYSISDMVKGSDLVVSATGITDGVMFKGVRYFPGGAETSSIVMRQKTHTLRMVNAIHRFDYKPVFM
jgi:fructose-1,6-bisphosphatase II